MTLLSLVKFDLIAIVFAESMVEFELGVCFSTLKKPLGWPGLFPVRHQ